jgi:hypothetical protein
VSEALQMLADQSSDTAVNAAWDDLLQAALRAWSWRDPETIANLDAAIGRVRPMIVRDWLR